MTPHVTTLRVAPVKALRSVRRDRVVLERQGVAEDRRLFLLDAHGAVITLRDHPQLTQVVPDLDLAEHTLSVRLPGGTVATSELTATGEPVNTTLFGKDRSGRVVAGPVAGALSDYVGEPVRLVLADRTGVGWDEGPVSLIGRASAEAVAAPEEPGAPPAERFRMLVEIGGVDAYEEDSWPGRRVRLGEDVVLQVTHPLGRCVIINSSPATGAKDWQGLKTLAALRGPDRVTLGVIASVERPGAVSVGDTVTVLSVLEETAPA